jgi:predicted cation transporter
MVITGLIVVLLMVLVLPFAIKRIEANLEVFLFIMGVAASSISGIMSVELVLKALKEPWMIALAVLVAGLLFFILKDRFASFMKQLFEKIPVYVVVFLVILLLGLLSSVITAIIASIILVEIIYLLPMQRKQKIVVCIIACFSIGVGATLTPIGEPLATIAISKLDKDFFYLIDLLSKYVIPAVAFFALLGGLYSAICMKGSDAQGEFTSTADKSGYEPEIEEESWQTIIVRALKVYLFVMALVFLGEGFEPLINEYILGLSPNLLFWVNMVSAVLDNATLTAAEISPQMDGLTVEAILMGLLISGGMLIPGNIPNIISASKLKITSTEWAKLGVPLGLLVMGVFYILLFVIMI